MIKLYGAIGSMLLLLSAEPLYAQENIDNFFSRERLTGDWGGTRSDLAKDGVMIDLSYTAFYQGMFSGTGDDDFDFGDRLDALINMDLGRLGLWQGGGFHTHLEYNSGNIPAWRGRALIPLNIGAGLPLGETEKVVASSLYISQKLSDSASLMLGKFNVIDFLANDPFFGGWGNERFMNCAFVAPLSGVLPPTIMGAIVNYRVNPITWTLMVYDPNDHTSDYSFNHLFADGVNLSLAATWSGTLAERASSVNINGIYSSQEKVDLGDFLLPPDLQTNIRKGTWHLSVKFNHLLMESPVLKGKGLGVHAKAGLSNGNTNVFQSFIIGGLAGHGMVPGRPNDVFGVGYFYYNFSDALQDATSPIINFDNEEGVEVFYNLEVNPWFKVTADLQWIDPATGDNKNIWLGGVRTSITF